MSENVDKAYEVARGDRASETLPFGVTEREVFTDEEAAAFLRLNASTPQAARRAMGRLVDRGKLRPTMLGNKRRWWKPELVRFLREQTESYSDVGVRDVGRLP